MIIAGIDMGIENTKCVIMRDGEIIGRAVVSSGGTDRPAQAKKAYSEALSAAGVTEKDVERVTATGKGKYDIPFADAHMTEPTAAAHAARFCVPESAGVLSVGADETIAAALGDKRLIDEFVINQKCTAGLGTFLKYLAQRLDVPMDRAEYSNSAPGAAVNEGCVVFSELDALSMLNGGVQKDAIMASAIRAAAARAATVWNDLTMTPEGSIVLIGGLTKNSAFVRALKEYLSIEFIIPDDAEFCGAIGAAIGRMPNAHRLPK